MNDFIVAACFLLMCVFFALLGGVVAYELGLVGAFWRVWGYS